MENIQLIEGKNAVLVPLKKWERVQSELVRLRKKVNKAKVLSDLKTAIMSVETEIRNGEKPKGTDAREFVKELLNEK